MSPKEYFFTPSEVLAYVIGMRDVADYIDHLASELVAEAKEVHKEDATMVADCLGHLATEIRRQALSHGEEN